MQEGYLHYTKLKTTVSTGSFHGLFLNGLKNRTEIMVLTAKHSKNYVDLKQKELQFCCMANHKMESALRIWGVFNNVYSMQ